jgi:hypothetical protein
MFTTAILTLTCCQVPYGPQSQWGWDGTVQNRSGWGYAQLYGNGYYPPWVFYGGGRCGPSGCCNASRASLYYTSPWNAAVAELRAAGPRRSSDKRPPGDVQRLLADLDTRRADLYEQLRSAEPQSKAALRAEWLQARQDLERARLQAARLARR